MAGRDIHTKLLRRAHRAGVAISHDVASTLSEYYELLARWNKKINLTSLEDPDEALDRLLLEPLVATRHFPPALERLMDVGSGGGSPAIPLAVMAGPKARLTMVEVKARKSAFLREAVRTLRLDASVETSRYEELLARPELHERFDLLSLRAVRVESKVLNSLQAFVRPGGLIFLFRGPSGPVKPDSVIPPLEWQGTHPLVESLQSRLTILRKREAPDYVPNGLVRM